MAGTIAVVGIDVGTQSVVIGQCRRGGVDIILNEASKRLTPSLVSFNGNERMLGEAAVTQVRTNMANTVTEVKRYIGRRYDEQGVQDELSENANFDWQDLGDGQLGVEVTYNGDASKFTMTQIYAMLLTKARQIVVLNNPGVKSVDAVITVPAYYTHEQRRAVFDAAAIAELNCLRLLNEGTSAALSYGIFKGAKKEFPEGKETSVMFLDMGASACTATIASFTNTSLKVIASASCPTLGGRDFDTAISKYIAAEFKAKYGSDPWKSAKARIKMFVAAEKAKVSISPHGVNSAPISIECLYEDRDFNGNLTEEKLVELMGAVVTAKLGAVIRQAMAQAGMQSYQELAAIELVGGSMRPRLVKRVAAQTLGMPLDEANGHGLHQSMNLDETIARGAALACAALSPVFKVKPFDIIDSVVYPVKLSYENQPASAALAEDAMEEEGADGAAAGTGTGSGSTIIFKTGDKYTDKLVRRVTFRRAGDFEVSLDYDIPAELASMYPATVPTSLGKFVVKVPAEALVPGQPAPKVRVNFEFDRNGLVYVGSAEAMKPVEEAPAPAEGGAAAAPAAGDVPMEGGAAAGAEAKKKKFKRVDAAVTPAAYNLALHGLSSAALKAAKEAEVGMQARDNEIHATQDMRNSLEAYIYNARSAVEDTLQQYTTQAERDAVASALGDMENWLYGDGFDSDKATYQGKLNALKAQCEPLFARKWEAENRYAAQESLKEVLSNFRDVQSNKSGKHGHLTDEDRHAIETAVVEAENWLRHMHEEQGKKEMYQEPVLRVAEINAMKDRVSAQLAPIANKRAPAPAPVPAPAPAPAPAGAPEAAPADGAQQVPPPAPADDQPMS